MPIKCFVPGCKSNYSSQEGFVSSFKFPKEEDRRQLWIRNIGRADFAPTKHSIVCAKHFEEHLISTIEVYKDGYGVFRTHPRTKPILLPEAVPTIFPPKEQSETTHHRIKKYKRKGSFLPLQEQQSSAIDDETLKSKKRHLHSLEIEQSSSESNEALKSKKKCLRSLEKEQNSLDNNGPLESKEKHLQSLEKEQNSLDNNGELKSREKHLQSLDKEQNSLDNNGALESREKHLHYLEREQNSLDNNGALKSREKHLQSLDKEQNSLDNNGALESRKKHLQSLEKEQNSLDNNGALESREKHLQSLDREQNSLDNNGALESREKHLQSLKKEQNSLDNNGALKSREKHLQSLKNEQISSESNKTFKSRRKCLQTLRKEQSSSDNNKTLKFDRIYVRLSQRDLRKYNEFTNESPEITEEQNKLPVDGDGDQVAIDVTEEISHDSLLCRLCAAPSEDAISLFENEYPDYVLLEKIHTYLPIKISSGDLLPTVICRKCIDRLEICHNLVQDCLDADVLLKTKFGLQNSEQEPIQSTEDKQCSEKSSLCEGNYMNLTDIKFEVESNVDFLEDLTSDEIAEKNNDEIETDHMRVMEEFPKQIVIKHSQLADEEKNPILKRLLSSKSGIIERDYNQIQMTNLGEKKKQKLKFLVVKKKAMDSVIEQAELQKVLEYTLKAKMTPHILKERHKQLMASVKSEAYSHEDESTVTDFGFVHEGMPLDHTYTCRAVE